MFLKFDHHLFLWKLSYSKIYISAELSINMLNKESKISTFVDDMAKDSSIKQIVYIRAHKVGDRNIIIKVQMHYFFYKSIH